MLIGSSNQLRKDCSIILNLDGSFLESQSKSKLKNLGVIFDSSLSFDYHVQYTVKNSFFHLRNIARLRSMLSLPVTERLINTLVFSRIDYCNALLVGVPKTTLNKLQCVQNSAARILTGARKNEHITPILKSLHWLPVRFRVDLKILMLTYEALHGLAPLSRRKQNETKDSPPGPPPPPPSPDEQFPPSLGRPSQGLLHLRLPPGLAGAWTGWASCL